MNMRPATTTSASNSCKRRPSDYCVTHVGKPYYHGVTATTDTPSVLSKAQRILDAFRLDDDQISLSELTRRSGLAKATVYRLCQELTEWGLLERSGTGYRLGLLLFEIGQRVPQHRILVDAARPFLEDAFVATGEAVHLAVRDGLTVMYLEKIGSRRVGQPSRVGGHLPLYSTSTGKVILAFSPARVIADVMSAGMVPMTRHTVIAPGHLQAQLARIRAEKIFTEVEETRLGYLSTAVPLFGPADTIVGAVAITAPIYRAQRPRIASAVRAAGDNITRALAG